MTEMWVGGWLIGLLLLRTQRLDRRLLARLPHIGAAVVIGSLIVYALVRVLIATGRRDQQDAAFLRVLAGLCGGFAMPLVYAWTRALLNRDLPRAVRAVRAEPGWYAVCAAAGAVCALLYFLLGRQFALRGTFEVLDTIFGADVPFQQYGLGARIHPHTHPLLPLLWRIGCAAAVPLAGLQWAPLALNSAVGGACLSLAALYLRQVTGSRAAGLLGGLILASSAGHVVFGSAPESWVFSAAALILLHRLVAARPRARRHRHLVLASLLATGVTVTHAAAALVCWLLAQRRPGTPGRLARFALHAVALGAFAFALQGVVVPDGDPLIPARYLNEARFVEMDPSLGQRLRTIAHGVFVQNVVGWIPRASSSFGRPGLAASWNYDALGKWTAAAWLCLVAFALTRIAAGRVPIDRPMAALWGCLALAAALFSYYGLSDLFLYSATFTFFVVAIVVRGVSQGNRRLGVAMLAAFWLLLLVNNARFAIRALATLDRLGQSAP